ncbi:S8 family serine peptidase [Clostridium formicaceticum]|uniref:Thermitase n=1 Tax=Clostridium formicaceticum TaxID=1497 RepID=A0AAC9WHF0_9CLOT|nr:S8 family serine peptidase [Clostridium formicaceticum]AOY74546.1 hypothetical protein BJL90_00400 [Clostridium formicaceticum]ARE88903.1 Thermitase [Clostridium formicaceticum]
MYIYIPQEILQLLLFPDSFMVHGALLVAYDTSLIAKNSEKILGIQKWNNHSGNADEGEYIVGHHWGILGLVGSFLTKRFLCFPLIFRLISGKSNPCQWICDADGMARPMNFWDNAHAALFQFTDYIKVTAKNFDLENNQYNLFIEKLNNPDDENFQEQWGLLNYLNGLDINILPAWQYSKGNGFKIGIADTGTDDNHIDLKKNIDLTLAYNFIHNMKDVFPANENLSASSARAGHGTHVAGIIGAEANNGQGIAGIAPESTPIPLKVLGSRIPEYPVYNGAIASFVNSIQYAKDNDIRIMNCSFGGYAPAVSEQEAMLKAEEILFVIAAGNDGNDLSINPEYPACYYHDNSIVVAAVNANGELAIFSNYGGPTDIAAPGEKILSTYPQNNYTYKNGTSMAAPVVSAVAGLVWSDDLGLTPIEIKERLTADSNVTKLDSLKNKVLSDGVVNAFKVIVSNKTETSARSIKGIDRNIFGRDIKAKIKYYKDNTKNHEKTDKIIVKFADGVELVDFINNINQKNIFKKIKQVQHLELINAYVFEFSSVEEADKAVDVFNAYVEVVYAEPNYLRSQN